METRDKILKYVRSKGEVTSNALVLMLGISRQSVARHLRNLVHEGHLQKSGSTRNAVYGWSTKAVPQVHELTLVKSLKKLDEDKVFEEVESRIHLKKMLSPATQRIAYYSFTEMLNNAIDHSKSDKAKINVRLSKGIFEFEIKDSGIGAFANVKKSFKLGSEYEAAEHLFKGKQTTDPSRHSGQGIFFTSRIADIFELRSHNVTAVIDNEREDFLLKDDKNIKGTSVKFQIRQKSRKDLQELFKKYADEDFEFDRSDVRIKLSSYGRLVSRSQARRLLAGLDEYKHITFDFQGIDGVGQAFADEIFRVFKNRFPKILVSFKNASPAVEFMISRALGHKLPTNLRIKL